MAKLTLLVASFLLGASVISAAAQEIRVGSVFECSSSIALRAWSSDEAFSEENRQEFLVRVDNEELQFISKFGHVSGSTLKKLISKDYLLTGNDQNTVFAMEQINSRFRFHYSSTYSVSIFAMLGYCEQVQ